MCVIRIVIVSSYFSNLIIIFELFTTNILVVQCCTNFVFAPLFFIVLSYHKRTFCATMCEHSARATMCEHFVPSREHFVLSCTNILCHVPYASTVLFVNIPCHHV